MHLRFKKFSTILNNSLKVVLYVRNGRWAELPVSHPWTELKHSSKYSTYTFWTNWLQLLTFFFFLTNSNSIHLCWTTRETVIKLYLSSSPLHKFSKPLLLYLPKRASFLQHRYSVYPSCSLLMPVIALQF